MAADYTFSTYVVYDARPVATDKTVGGATFVLREGADPLSAVVQVYEINAGEDAPLAALVSDESGAIAPFRADRSFGYLHNQDNPDVPAQRVNSDQLLDALPAAEAARDAAESALAAVQTALFGVELFIDQNADGSWPERSIVTTQPGRRVTWRTLSVGRPPAGGSYALDGDEVLRPGTDAAV